MKKLIIPMLFVANSIFGQEADIDTVKTFTVKCYPNPTTDLLMISASEEIEDIMLLDLNGSVIKAPRLPNNCYSLSEIPSGWVFVFVTAKDGRVEKRNVWKN